MLMLFDKPSVFFISMKQGIKPARRITRMSGDKNNVSPASTASPDCCILWNYAYHSSCHDNTGNRSGHISAKQINPIFFAAVPDSFITMLNP